MTFLLQFEIKSTEFAKPAVFSHCYLASGVFEIVFQ